MPSFNEEFKLASLDFMGDPRELEAKTQAAVEAAGPDYRVPDRLEGADGTGLVRVVVDQAGQVCDVDIGARWLEQIQPGDFSAALFSAYVAAQGKAIEATTLAELVAQRNRTDDDRARDMRRRQGEIGAALSYVAADDQQAWLRKTWDKLYEIDDKLHATARDVAPAQQKRAHSPHGLFTFTYNEHSVTGIAGDVERIRHSDSSRLRTEALAAFRSAQLGGGD